MCEPRFFTVAYKINPWMEPAMPTDTARAVAQWRALRAAYDRVGIAVRTIEPRPGLPDMVFTANGGFVIDGVGLGAKFAHAERAPEARHFDAWLRSTGVDVAAPVAVNEGEGDFLLAGGAILAGSGFRSTAASHGEVAALFGKRVLSLTLVDPRFYHLDTCLAVLDDETLAYYPPAFDAASVAALTSAFPRAFAVSEADARCFGLNAFSDGRHVITAAAATGFHAQLAARGFVPVGVDLGELLLGGGGAKCCTLELR